MTTNNVDSAAKDLVTPKQIEVKQELVTIALNTAITSMTVSGSAKEMREVLAAVLAYIANHPQVPDLDQERELVDLGNDVADIAANWMRIAFLKPSPAIPAGVKALLIELPANQDARNHNEAVLAAYALGEMNGRAK